MTDQVSNLEAKGVRAALLAADLTSREDQTRIHQEAADPKASGLRFLCTRVREETRDAAAT